ncbi:MAG: hypothetical protein WC919_01050 [Candidatus Paceibacterota bacterium]|jgi:hypothetical protein
MAKELRSDLAKARDMWLASDEGQRSCAGSAEGLFLRNRIEGAFLAGAKIAETLLAEKLKPIRATALELADKISTI